MKRFLFALCLFTAAVCLDSCENEPEEDDKPLIERLVNRAWVGDLAFASTDGYPLLSKVIFILEEPFSPKHLYPGFMDLYFYPENGGGLYQSIYTSWYFNEERLTTYRPDMRELRNITIQKGVLEGDLYINEIFCYRVTLREE